MYNDEIYLLEAELLGREQLEELHSRQAAAEASGRAEVCETFLVGCLLAATLRGLL